jgi:hypothetical protein
MTKRPVAPSKPVAYAKAKEGERADGLKMTSAEAEQTDLRERGPTTESGASIARWPAPRLPKHAEYPAQSLKKRRENHPAPHSSPAELSRAA